MQKPSNYDNIQLGNALKAGKHRCVIKKVEETESRSGLEMLIVYFDTAPDDFQPKYYESSYERRAKNNPDTEKWCRKWIVTDSSTDYGDRNLKSFNTAVENSNDGFEVKWGKSYCSCFTGKKVGVIFGEEEYTKADHQIGCAVKPAFFCSYPKDEELGKDAPARKNLPEDKPSIRQQYEQQVQEGFMQIPDDLSDEGLPFSTNS